MSHQEPNQEFAPALQPDFTNQDHVFIVLEELGIAYMQNAWIERKSPDHADAAAVKAQSEEFREDVVSLLTGKAEKSRYVDNGWVGAKLAAHLRKVFGDNPPPVSATKSATGHMMGAGGVTEVIACVKAVETGILPPTLHVETADPACDLDVIPNEARRAEIRYAMSNAFGFGGQNSSVIVGRFE